MPPTSSGAQYVTSYAFFSRVQHFGEDAIWSHETASAEVLAAVRKLPPRQLIALAMDFGLYERLREPATG